MSKVFATDQKGVYISNCKKTKQSGVNDQSILQKYHSPKVGPLGVAR